MLYAHSLHSLLSILRPSQDFSGLEEEILKCFQTFSHFIDAPISELTRLGFSSSEILFIKSVIHGVERYLDTNPKYLNTTREIGKYVITQIGFKEKEWSINIYLNDKNKVLFVERYSTYERTNGFQDFERIITTCAKTGAIKVIIGHNHPEGNPEPSEPDEIQYDVITEYLNENGITLCDDIIATVSAYWSMRLGYSREVNINPYPFPD